MMNFNSLTEVANYFANEDKAHKFLENWRWPDGRIVCPLCGVRDAYRNSDCKTYKCRDKDCKSAFSITKGTWFENTKLPLSKWFMAIYLCSAHKKGISSHQLGRDLNIGQKAAWFVLHRVRAMLTSKSLTMLSNIVEIDETYTGGRMANMNKTKRTYMRDRMIDNKTPVMGMVERGGNVRLQVIGKKSFKTIIHDNVKKEAILITDAHTGYEGLDKEYKQHEAVNHSQFEFKRGIYYTNSVEGFFSIFKRMVIGTYHHLSPKHLQRYCEEVSFRYNSRKIKDGERFASTFKNVNGRLTYKQLVGNTKPYPSTSFEFLNTGLPLDNGKSIETKEEGQV